MYHHTLPYSPHLPHRMALYRGKSSRSSRSKNDLYILSVDSSSTSTSSIVQSSRRADWVLHNAYEYWRREDEYYQQLALKARAIEQSLLELSHQTRRVTSEIAMEQPVYDGSLFSVLST